MIIKSVTLVLNHSLQALFTSRSKTIASPPSTRRSLNDARTLWRCSIYRRIDCRIFRLSDCVCNWKNWIWHRIKSLTMCWRHRYRISGNWGSSMFQVIYLRMASNWPTQSTISKVWKVWRYQRINFCRSYESTLEGTTVLGSCMPTQTRSRVWS